jgi:DNA-binding MarR family transcriptional regulator
MTNATEVLHRLPHVPPSVETVFTALYGNPPMTSMDLRRATHLPRRTIYAALQKLKELGVLEERPSLRDTRQTYFWITHLERYTGNQETGAVEAHS